MRAAAGAGGRRGTERIARYGRQGEPGSATQAGTMPAPVEPNAARLHYAGRAQGRPGNRSVSKVPVLTLAEKNLVMHTVTWVKTVNDSRPAGTPPSYPLSVDIDSSALFKRIRQGLAPLPNFSGQYAVIGSWLVDHTPCGLSVREDENPITGNTSRFLPHAIIG